MRSAKTRASEALARRSAGVMRDETSGGVLAAVAGVGLRVDKAAGPEGGTGEGVLSAKGGWPPGGRAQNRAAAYHVGLP
ncbi:hypothetical protein D9M68_1001020 [compost metagenome]